MAAVPRKPLFKLGSGLFDQNMQEQPPMDPSAFALGSGLYGQQTPQPEAGAAPGWVSAEGGTGYANGQADWAPPQQAAPAAQGAGAAKPGFMDGLAGAFGSPVFQLGMSLLGNARSPTGTSDALGQMMHYQNMMRQQQIAQGQLGVQQQAVNQTGQYQQGQLGLAQQKAPFEQGLMGAQTGNLQAETGLHGAQANQMIRQQILAEALLRQQNLIPQGVVLPQAGTGAPQGQGGRPPLGQFWK